MTFPLTSAFFKKSGGGGFRFLHDELSGGIFAGGHLQYKSTYSGQDVITLTDPADYSFGAAVPSTGYALTGNTIDLTPIQAAFPTSTRIRVFNHLDFATFIGRAGNPGPGWNGTDFMVSGGVFDLPSTRSQFDPFTFICVIEGMDNIVNGTYITQSNVVNPRIHIVNGTTTRFWVGTSFTNYAGKNYATSLFKNSGVKLLIATWDGSGLPSGADIYINDMVTPLSGTNASNGTFTNTNYNLITFNNLQSVNVKTPDEHYFDYAMDATDRAIVKEILEQYYTFS